MEHGGSPAAVIAFVRGSGATLQAAGQGERTAAVSESVAIGDSVETDADGRLGLRLADGRRIRLDHATRITIASRTAIVLDHGMVFVDSDGAGGPFAIRSGTRIITDVGTEFEVATAPSSLRVRVRSGRIIVAGDGTTITADAGAEVAIGSDGVVRRRAFAVDDPAWDWALASPAPYVLDGMSLRAFLDRISAEGGLDLRLPEDVTSAAAGIRLSGTLPEATPIQALDAVLPTCGLRFRATGRIVTIAHASPGDDP
ncbi:MAG: FecR domain-containing protein [Planctomycetes bacterium]|nr:FecR domain-containing protein [Planctomycetota bacterium]